MRGKILIGAIGSAATAVLITGCGGSNSSLAAPTAPIPYSANAGNPQTQGIVQALQVLKPAVTSAMVDHFLASTAIWTDIKDASKSIVFATDNDSNDGGIVAVNLSGKTIDKVKGLKGAYGADVQYGYQLGKDKIDILVVSEVKAHQLRIYKIVGGDKPLVDITGKTAVFDKSTGSQAEPTELGLYHRFDGNIFAVVSRSNGPEKDYLGEYKLINDNGKVSLQLARYFGNFSGSGQDKDGTISAITVDSTNGRVIYDDFKFGYREYRVDPDAKDADHELGLFSQQGYSGARGAVAIAKDYLVALDLSPDGSTIHFYPRVSKSMARTESALMKSVADNSTGLAISTHPIGKKYPEGIMVATSAKDKTLQIYDWKMVSKNLDAARAAQFQQPIQQPVAQGAVPVQPGTTLPGQVNALPTGQTVLPPVLPGQPLSATGTTPPPATGTGAGTDTTGTTKSGG